MTFGLSAAAIGGIASAVGGIGSALIGSNAASSAANAQTSAANAGIAEQDKQFSAIQALLAPYANAGVPALTAQSNLLGLNGQPAQSSAISGIQNGSQFQALQKVGNNAILQSSAATGGLRGGNVEGALAQFSPALLQSLIQQQFQNLGGITSIGQNAAAMTGNAGLQTGNSIASLLQQGGAATAGGILGNAKGLQNGISSVTGALGNVIGGGGLGNLGINTNNNGAQIVPGYGYINPSNDYAQDTAQDAGF